MLSYNCGQVASTSADFQPDERDPEVELVLTESDYTLKMWPHKFKAVSRTQTKL
jgi:glucose-6-phosphate 1-epimerase